MQILKRAIIILALFIPFSIISLFLPLPSGEGFEVRGLVEGLASLFSVQSAEAYTYQDVENAYTSYKTQYPNDYIWKEEFNRDGQKGYKIWKRPKISTWVSRKIIFINGSPTTGTYSGYISACTGNRQDLVFRTSKDTFYWFSSTSSAAHKIEYKYCDGSTITQINNIPPAKFGISDTCWYDTQYNNVNCAVNDVLLATFFPIDECEDNDGDGVTTCDGDCNDNDPAIYPGAKENCDGKDNNCNEDIDEGACDCSVELNLSSSANAANGSLSHSQTIFQTPNSKLLSDFTLYYNSLYSGSGHLGTGWSHSYDITLKEFADGSILFREGNNRKLYTLSGSNYVNQTGDYSTLIKNTDGSYILTKKDGTKYTFDTSGKLMKTEDRLGNSMTFTYGSTSSPGQLLTEITDSVGRKTTLSYDSNNRITQIKAPSTSTFTLTYNSLGYLITVTDQAGYSWTYTYDSNGRMLTKSDTEGNIVTYAYDSQGRIISSTDSSGKAKTITYPTDTNTDTDTVKTTTVTETNGGTWTYTYDSANGTLTQKTDPQGNITTYQYDSNRNLTKETAPDGSTTAYTYDTQGNMTSTTDSLGQTTTYTYNDYGQVTSIKDSQSNVTHYSYDVYGNLTSVTDLSGGITQFNYDSKGNITRITSPNGGVTVYEYDSYNNLIKITDPGGNTTTFTYDSAGNMMSMTDSQGNATRFEYNSLNQLIKVIDSSGNVTEYSFDSRGNKTSQTDANGNTTYYEYNSNDKLVKVTDALNSVTTYTYGGTGGCPSCGGSASSPNLTAIKDANGNITTYEYDTLGRLTKETDTLGNSITYSYDSRGNLTSRTDANGNTIAYTYDSLGRLLKKKYPDNTEETFTYDSKGNILTATNQHISYTFTYDASGKPLTGTDSYGRVTKYEYDTAGNKVKMITPEGKEIKYNYDISHRLTQINADSIIASETKQSQMQTFSFTYDTSGRRTKLTYPNEITTTYSYDSIGRLTNLLTQYIELQSQGKKKPPNLKLHTIDSFTYTHDKVGNRLTKSETSSPSPLEGEGGVRGVEYSYSYDAIYRLLQSTPAKIHKEHEHTFEHKSEVFTYDPVGNRLTGQKEKLNYTYNAANQLTELVKEKKDEEEKKTEYTYDKNGNLTKKIELDDDGNVKRTTLYTYDYENRLIKVEILKSEIQNPKSKIKVVTFTYDPFGRRLSKTVHREEIEDEDYDKDDEEKEHPRATYYVYDNEDIIMEYNHKGKVRARYIHGQGIDESLAIEQKEKVYYYHFDGLGSVTALTDSKGKVVQRYDYDSFGNLKHHGHKVKQPYTYTAREYDRETGLYYYRARYYDAKVGRFISFDPILKGISHTETATCRKSISSFPLQQPQKFHPFVYAGNAPITFVDPWGECPATIDTGWMYKTEGPNRATDYRYQSQYKERTIGTLIKQSGKCKNRCGGTIDCTYIFAESYYARKRDYDRGTQTYGSWGGWRGYENENIGTGILRYSCEQQRFIGGSNFNN